MAAMHPPCERPWKAYLALGLGLIVLGFSAIFIRWADAPGPVAGFYRMAVGGLILSVPFGRRLIKRETNLPLHGVALASLAGLFFGADVTSWATGVVMSGATLPTLFANTNPVWVGLGAMLLFREKLKPSFWLGLLLALAGAAIILGVDLRDGLVLNQGALLGALAGLFYGSYFLVAQRGRRQLAALAFFWFSTVSSALTLLASSLLLGHSLTGYPTMTWIVFIAQGIVIQAAGWFLISYAQGYLPASLVSPTLLGQPVLTAILAGPLLGETLRSDELLGGLAVLAGIFIVHGSRARRTDLDVASEHL
jgi:drug/metabolite transporter (DMT)-like permease